MEITNLTSSFKFLFLFIILVLTQVLICNNILLFGLAVPFVFIFFIITLPLNTSLNVLMTLSFLLGLFVDFFSDTLGLCSLACLLLSLLKKPFFYAYMPKEDKFNDAVPCLSTMGWSGYLKFILSLCAAFCIMIFGIELFSFASFGRIIAMASASTLLTLLLVIGIDALFNKE